MMAEETTPANSPETDPAASLDIHRQEPGNVRADNLIPDKAYPPIETVANDDLETSDMNTYALGALQHTNLIGHNLSSFNSLVETGLAYIFTNLFSVDLTQVDNRDQTEMDKLRESIRIQVKFTEADVGVPTYSEYFVGKTKYLMPNFARRCALTYNAPVSIAATVTLTAKYKNDQELPKVVNIPKFQFMNIPIMIRSNRCHTFQMSREALKEIEEDPNERGGYFIAHGSEYAVESLENIRFNILHSHFRIMPNEIIRGEFISQPGGTFENSSEITIRHMTSGAITLEINSTKFLNVQIPFYLLYRVFGMVFDKEIVETIVLDIESTSPVVKKMLEMLETAFKLSNDKFEVLKHVTDPEVVVELMADRMFKFTTTVDKSDDIVRDQNNRLRTHLDWVVLPHIGMTDESRIKKLRFLGLLINEMLQVEMGILTETDRDSYRNKRVHDAGISLAKSIKTHFNRNVVIPIQKTLRRLVKQNPFENIDDRDIIATFQNVISGDLNKVMEQAITTGNKAIRLHLNRVASSVLERKNTFNTDVMLRTVVAHNPPNASKQASRADLMRRVHPSYWGFICVLRSADTGATVGVNKELAITATVAGSGEPLLLKEHMSYDSELISVDDVTGVDISRRKLTAVMVNGDWVGCCADPISFLRRYKLLRREGKVVDPTTTIAWNPVIGRVEFELDMGRIVRPLLIVDSNVDEYDAACRAAFAAKKAGDKNWEKKRIPFFQNIRMTKKHANGIRFGRMTMDDLRKDGLIEYVSAEEQENCYIAENIHVLRQNSGNILRQYTHCDVDIAIFGMSALQSPFVNCTQPVRGTYETNQSRSSAGYYAFNWPYRVDRLRFNQFAVESPLVSTIVSRVEYPNGLNCVVAYACYGGDNQEDSAIFNKASIERGVLEGSFFNYEKAEIERGQKICTPNPATTKNMNPDASYEKLVDGVVPVGTVLYRGDVMIGRTEEITRGEDRRGEQFVSVDKSVVYKYNQPAVVDAVWKPHGANDEMFALVKFRNVRPLEIGDKLSSREGNKLIVASCLQQSDMPRTVGGMTPDIIVNPHSIPTRMTIGQMLEAAISKVCARKGCVTDGTAFSAVNTPEIAAELVRHGFRFNGRERMFNGMTGEAFDAAIFIAPTFIQRLQKFIADDYYVAPMNGPSDAVTGQPLAGKRLQGGLRLGEMEGWVFESHGAMLSLYEKFSVDSDGRKQAFCRRCGQMGIYNPGDGIYQCRICQQMAELVEVPTSKSAAVFREELQSSGIRLECKLRPKEFEKYE